MCLVALVKDGDNIAFAALTERYFDRLFTYLQIALADAAAAERATEATFAEAHDSVRNYDQRAERSVRVWLFGLAAASAARTLNERERLAPPEGFRRAGRRAAEVALEPRLHALDELDDAVLLTVVNELPRTERQVLMLRYMLGLTSAEIARVLGCLAADTRVLHYHAMIALGHALRADRVQARM